LIFFAVAVERVAHARTDAERYGSDAAALGLVRIIGLITAGS